jgi:hypothetical protein
VHLGACTTTHSSNEELLELDNEETASLRVKASGNRVTSPFIWKVEKDGKASYLFGTIHVGIPIGKLPWNVLMKLKSVKTVVAEADPALVSGSDQGEDSPIQKLLRQKQSDLLLPEGKNLSDLISKESFDIFLKDTRLPEEFAENLSPYGAKFFYDFMSLAISLNVVPEGNLDSDIIKIARDRGQQVEFLEGSEEVDRFMADALGFDEKLAKSYKPKDVENFLLNEAKASRQQVLRGLFSMIIAYKTGSISNIERQAERYLDQVPNLRGKLIDERNKAWMKNLSPVLANGNAFVAVGVMHFPGESGIVSLLKKDGYKVERL